MDESTQLPQRPFDLKDKVVFLTGASGLIGKPITKAYLRHGANVLMADLHYPSDKGFMEELEKNFKGQYLFVETDITQSESAEQAAQTCLDHFGRLDVLINNAAIDAKFDQQADTGKNASRFENFPLESLEKSIDVNLTGTIRMTQIACKHMLQQGHGIIINVASTYSLVAPNQQLYDFDDGKPQQYKPVDYIATKSFVANFTRYIATFYAREGIRCNAIVPHAIYNNHDQAFLGNFKPLSPLGRMCEVEELEAPFLFLASDQNSYMTGSVLTVDGGWTAW